MFRWIFGDFLQISIPQSAGRFYGDWTILWRYDMSSGCNREIRDIDVKPSLIRVFEIGHAPMDKEILASL